MPSDYKAITKHNEKRLGSDTASRKTQVSMYSDSAHFVYEILQNADDYGATEVAFKLSKNEIVIEYNGEPFSEKHVKAITYFGKSTSRDDLVKTGRFGVGFKSVFAFTANPIIISGNEHFQIYDLYRIREHPYPDGFSRCRTRIVLPFDHESEQPDFVEKLMPQEEAHRQISECLTTLDMNTLLFTRNIREIRWEVDDRSACYKRKDEIDRNARLTTITKGQHESKYLVFSKVPKWENQAYKAVEIAFSADSTDQLSPIDDDFLYVLFTTQQKTDLRFILNGPYRTNPARETISTTDDFNAHLMKVTCEFMKELLLYLRERKMITVQFLSVLPNQADRLEDFYTPLRDTIVDEFRNQKLTPTKRGDYAAASGLYQYEKELSDLIQDEDLATLLGKDRSLPLWATDPQLIQRRDERGRFVPDPNAQRVGDFLTMLDISEWTIDDFIRVLETKSEQIMEWLKGKKEDWHQDLYVLLGDFLSRASPPRSYVAHVFKTRLSNLRIVHCSDGIYRVGSECHFLGDDIEPDEDLQLDATILDEENQSSIQEENEHEEDFHYVAKGVCSSGGNSDLQEKAHKFLEDIGVSEVGEAERIKVILKQRYVKGTIKLREPHHKRDLERFIALVEDEWDKVSLFKEYFIFETDRDRDNKIRMKPNGVFLDSPYLETGLKAYHEALDEDSKDRKWTLSPKYAQSGIDPEKLGKFATAVGAQTQLKAFKQEIPDWHPEWEDYLSLAPGGWQTHTTIDEDYSIPEFDTLVDSPSIVKAKLIWRTMCSLPEYYLKARFRWNQSNELREGYSTLVHFLEETEWVPQKDGDSISFVCPCDASIERLPEGFQYVPGQKWLEAIKFGKTKDEVAELAEKTGVPVEAIRFLKQNPEEYVEFKAWKAAKTSTKQKTTDVETNYPHEGTQDIRLESQGERDSTSLESNNLTPLSSEYTIEDIALLNKNPGEFQEWKATKANGSNPTFPDRSVANPERWKTKFNEDLKNRPKKEYEYRERSVRVTTATAETRVWLKINYTNDDEQMVCQICEAEMPFKKHDGEYYFEAVEALTSEYFTKEHEAQFLALCPECAARYKEFIKPDDATIQAIINQLTGSDSLEVPLRLGELDTNLRFVKRHWLAIKEILKQSI